MEFFIGNLVLFIGSKNCTNTSKVPYNTKLYVKQKLLFKNKYYYILGTSQTLPTIHNVWVYGGALIQYKEGTKDNRIISKINSMIAKREEQGYAF